MQNKDEAIKNLKKVYKEDRKLVLSVAFGWTVILFAVVLPFILGSIAGMPGFIFTGFIFAAFLMALRYSFLSPALKAGVGGITTVGLVGILDMAFSRRESSGSATLAAFVGAAFVFLSILFWNGLKGFAVLLKESKSLFYVISQSESEIDMQEEKEAA